MPARSSMTARGAAQCLNRSKEIAVSIAPMAMQTAHPSKWGMIFCKAPQRLNALNNGACSVLGSGGSLWSCLIK